MGGFGCLSVTCGVLSSVKDGVEATGVSVGGMGCKVVTCNYLLAIYSFSCLPPFISCSFFSLFCYLAIILNLPSAQPLLFAVLPYLLRVRLRDFSCVLPKLTCFITESRGFSLPVVCFSFSLNFFNYFLLNGKNLK